MQCSTKYAYFEGAQKALQQHGLLPTTEPSTFQRALPWVAGAVAAPLAYKALRLPSFAKTPALRQIQEAAQKGFHRIVDVSPGKIDPTDAFKYRLQEWWRPKVRAGARDLSPWNRFKLWLQEGGEAIPVASERGRAWIPGAKKGQNVEGIVHGRHIEPYHSKTTPAKLVRGGTDIEGAQPVQAALTQLGESGKAVEADLLQRYAPGAAPDTLTDLRKYITGLKLDTPGDRITAAQQLRTHLKQVYGKDRFLLKPGVGLQSAGAFPWSHKNWDKAMLAYERHIADPKKLKALHAAEAKGPGDLAAYLERHRIEEGRVLHEAFRDPSSVIAQRAVKNPMGEFRVHVTAGKAPRGLILPRYGEATEFAKLWTGLGKVKTRELQEFAEKTIAKLPKDLREGSYGLDIMPYRKANGRVGFKIIELNPSEQAYQTASGRNMGGGSGLLDTTNVPWAGHAHYRAVTGRHTMPVALGGAAGAAGLAGGATALTTNRH